MKISGIFKIVLFSFILNIIVAIMLGLSRDIMSEEEIEDEWYRLQSEVNNAIKKHNASGIVFGSKNISQCRYIQKCADVEKSDYNLSWSAIIFMFAGATQLISKFKIDMDLTSTGQVTIGLIMIAVGFFIKNHIWMPEHNTCNKIILEAEKQIQKLSKEKTLQEKNS